MLIFFRFFCHLVLGFFPISCCRLKKHTQNMSFNLKDFCFAFAKDCSTFVISPLDGLKENTLPLSSPVLLMVKGESDADVLCKCLEIKMLTLLIDGESLWVRTQELIKLSVPHPATLDLQHLWKCPLIYFKALFLIPIHLLAKSSWPWESNWNVHYWCL